MHSSLLLLAAGAASASGQWRGSWTGELIVHPGLSAGYERPLAEGARLEVGLAAEAGLSWHPRNQLAAWGRGEVYGRHRGPRGGVHELFASAGPLRATWAADAVRVEDGQVTDAPLAGQGYLAGALGVGLGREVDRPGVDHWIIRPQLAYRAPHFYGLSLTPHVEIGLRFGGAS